MLKRKRTLFPIFKEQKELVYLDSAATSLKPFLVIEAINDYYQKYSVNSHSELNNPLFKKVWTTIQETRKLISQKIKSSSSKEIIFFPSATHALNILAWSVKNYLRKGDKILLTHLEHSSNLYPWQFIAQEKQAIIDYLPLNKEFVVDTNKIANYVDNFTKIVSFFHISNSLGVINPVAKITQKIKEINPNCLVIIDACQSIIHAPINVKGWNLDALVFSGHKAYGPTGIGVLWLKKELGEKLPDLLWGGGKRISPESLEKNLDLPQKFEVGSLPLAQIFGLKASFEFLNSFDVTDIYHHENYLKNYALQKLSKIKRLTIYGLKKASRQNSVSTNIITFNFDNYHAHDVADYLGRKNIYLRAGDFCNPHLFKIIKTNSALRISFGLYNNCQDIDKLVRYLEEIEKNPEVLFSIF